jgi:DNA-binding response OmpR family regulator
LAVTIPCAMMWTVPARPEAPILVVDDDPKIVALVRTYLEREQWPVVTAGDGRAALAAIEASHPRLVVLDLMLPGIDGMTVIRRAREEGDVPILVLSARTGTGDRVLGLTEGADDYLTKPFSPAELVARVRSILRRTEAPDANRQRVSGYRCGDLVVEMDRHTVMAGGREIVLSAVELRLLVALLAANGRTLDRDRLLDAIHGDDAFLTDRAIDVYVKRLREKLGDDAAEPRYIATVRGAGYRAACAVTRTDDAE